MRNASHEPKRRGDEVAETGKDGSAGGAAGASAPRKIFTEKEAEYVASMVAFLASRMVYITVKEAINTGYKKKKPKKRRL